MFILFVMLPKVDYVLITSLFCVQKYIVSDGANIVPLIYEVIECDETVWQRIVPLVFRTVWMYYKEEWIWHK